MRYYVQVLLELDEKSTKITSSLLEYLLRQDLQDTIGHLHQTYPVKEIGIISIQTEKGLNIIEQETHKL